MAVFYKIWDFLQNLKKNAAQNDKSSEDLNNNCTPPHKSLSIKDKEFIEKLHSMMENEISSTDIDIEKIAATMFTSRSRLFYKVKELTGMTPQKYFMEYRLERAEELLREGKYSITEISEMTGFVNASHFSTKFKKKYGIAPSRYNR